MSDKMFLVFTALWFVLPRVRFLQRPVLGVG